MASGGYHPPANPAPVSGPGALSKRTDGGPAQVLSAAPDQGYGDMTQQLNDQRTAPMMGATPQPSMPNVPASSDGFQMPAYQGGDFGAPSNRPGEPVTAGVPIGPGPGPQMTNMNVGAQPTGQLTQMLQSMSANDMTGVLAPLYQAALQYGV